MEDILLPGDRVKEFLENPTNKAAIRQIILTNITDDDSLDLALFDIPSHIAASEEKAVWQDFLLRLYETVKRRKKETFSVETLNILDAIQTLKVTFGSSLELNLSRESKEDIRTIVREELRQIGRAPGHVGVYGGVDEGIEIAEEKYRTALDEIKRLLDAKKNETARREALRLWEDIQRESTIEPEIAFLVNAYIAQSFLNSPHEQKNALPYLEKAAEVCPDEERKYRNQAIAHQLKGEIGKGLDAIDKALSSNPNKKEVLIVKANLLIAAGSPGEAEELFSQQQLSENPSLQFMKAYAEYKGDDYQAALSSVVELLKREEERVDAYILLSDIKFAIAQRQVNDKGRLTEENYSYLREAEEHLSKALELLDEEEKGKTAEVYARKGQISNAMRKPEAARGFYEEALKIVPTMQGVMKNLALSYWLLEEHERAIDTLKQTMVLTPDDTDLQLMHAEILVQSGRPEEAVSVLEKFMGETNDGRDEIRVIDILIEAYDRDFQTSRADEMISKLEEKYGDRRELKLIKARHLFGVGRYDSAIEILEPLHSEARGIERISVTKILADSYREKKGPMNFRKAAELYGAFANIKFDDGFLRNYVGALYHSRQYETCLELCREIQSANGFIELYGEIEAAIYYQSQNFSAAGEILKVLARRNPTNVKYMVNYGICLFYLGKTEEAVDVVRQAQRKVQDSANDLAFISTAYSAIGRFGEAVEFAFEALQKDPHDPQLHLHYVFTFMRAENFVDGFETKYIEKFQDCIENFNTRFPGEKGLEKRRVPDDPDQFREEISRMLEEYSGRREDMEKLYMNSQLPVASLAKGAGRDLISTWGAVVSHPYLKLWASSGNPQELQQEILIASVAKIIAIDIIAIMTLDHLDLLPVTLGAFEKALIPQEALNEISDLIAHCEMSVKKGHLTVWSEDGRLYRQEIPGEVIGRKIERLNKIRRILAETGNVEIIGRSVGRLSQEDDEDSNNLRNFIGEATYETLMEARSRSIPIYAEDLWLRNYAKIVSSGKSFGSRAVLESLLRKNIITEEKFHWCLVELLGLNYHFVSITAKTLMEAAKEANFFPTRRSHIPFESLRHRDNDINRLVPIAVAFLKWLWLESIPVESANTWTDIILNSVTSNRNKRDILRQIMTQKGNIISPLTPHIEPRFNNAIRTWMIAHRFVR